MMQQWIVITSIHPPTHGTAMFAKLKDWRIIVVGDQKTPKNWQREGVRFIDVGEQKKMPWRIARCLPWNHYSRKMIGYLCAMKAGATVIVDTDDDNIPKPDWRIPSFCGVFDVSAPKRHFINIYKYFSDQHIWPRGFPLHRITDQRTILSQDELRKEKVRVGIWQGLAEGDPDVDAVYRCILNGPCRFNDNAPLVLDKGTISPFNSQNTAFSNELFPLLYLPAFVNFRFTDILRGFVAQPIMWQHDYLLGFTHATVTQIRNVHDLMADFQSEIPCYLHAEKIVNVVETGMKKGSSIGQNLFCAYERLCKEEIVHEKELDLLEAWLKDVDGIE